MKRHWALALVMALGLFTAGCAGGIQAVSGAYPAGSAYTLQLSRTWSDISAIMARRPQNVRALTIDGPTLNLVLVGHDIAPSAGLFRPGRRDERLPVYRADMTNREMVEFVTDSLAILGLSQPEAQALRPATFAGRPGVSFGLRAQTAEGLNMVGQAAVAAQDGRLQVLIYIAAEEHFAPLHQDAVDSLFASVVQGRTEQPVAPAAAPAEAPAASPAPVG
jgi:hypothetical protein